MQLADWTPQKPRPYQNADAQSAAQLHDLLFPGQIASLQVFFSIVNMILGWYAASLEIYVRYRFGERYFTLIRLIMATTVFSGFSFVLNTVSYAYTGGWSFPLTLFGIGLWLMGFYHFFDIWRREWQGERWHSRSFGISRFSFLIGVRIPLPILKHYPISDWTLYRIVEPALCFGAGAVLMIMDLALGGWLLLSSVALALRTNSFYAQEREKLLNLIDAQIEAEATAAALEGRPKEQTLGISLVQLPKPIAAGVKQLADRTAATPHDFGDLLQAELGNRNQAPGARSQEEAAPPPTPAPSKPATPKPATPSRNPLGDEIAEMMRRERK